MTPEYISRCYITKVGNTLHHFTFWTIRDIFFEITSWLGDYGLHTPVLPLDFYEGILFTTQRSPDVETLVQDPGSPAYRTLAKTAAILLREDCHLMVESPTYRIRYAYITDLSSLKPCIHAIVEEGDFNTRQFQLSFIASSRDRAVELHRVCLGLGEGRSE